MLIVRSESMDVYRNLAVEEHLMEASGDQGPVLFLWRSDSAVVVGKNQNPWRECRLDRMRGEGVLLARRISGGGAVYHDAGNLNYCVVVDRADYREEQVYGMVIDALAPFGIRARRAGRSNLAVDGFKFSGNAFCYRGNRAMHHGTLLLEADLDRLGRYLGPMVAGIETHAIASVPAQVANLGLAGPAVAGALEQAFVAAWGGSPPERRNTGDFVLQEALGALAERHRSEAWLYGATPRFSVQWNGMEAEVSRGRIARIRGAGMEGWEGRSFAELAFSLFC